VKVPNCGVLVLKDTSATSQQRKDVPRLVGTNVLAQIPKFSALLQQRTDTEPRTSETCTSGFVCVTGSYPVMIPPNSVASVAASGVTIHIPCDSIQFRLPFDFDYFDSIMQNINVF